MRWQRGRKSGNVIDARGSSGRRSGGMPGGRAAVPGGLWLVGVLVFVAIQLLGGGQAFSVPPAFDDGTSAPDARGIPAGQDPERDFYDFSSYVFDNAQTMWAGTLDGYREAKMVVYRQGVDTGCGSASSSVGPFYVAVEAEVDVLPRRRARLLQQELQAAGDFAWAYVIAHEVGHHVQKVTGTSDEVRRLQQENRDEANALSVRLELQADCYAGVWAHSVFEAGDVEPGDLDEAIRASEAVGDDRLQRRASGEVNPDSFTHGTSAQRAKWFRAGQAAGEPAACDTFGPDEV